MTSPTPTSGAQRQAKYVKSGRPVSCVLRNRTAIAALRRLEKTHGGVTAAITAAVLLASPPAKSGAQKR